MIWLPIVGNYVEIDAYASIIAYADLLNQRGKPAKTYIPFAPNYSVPAGLRLQEQENTVFNLQPDDEAIILDVSVPEAINSLVPDQQILELIDHHAGYEEYWHSRLGNKAIIEKIGAVATSIFEWWGECWDYEKMSPQIAKLLLAAVLDNTLNFNAEITTDRDRKAAAKMAEIADTTVTEFAAWYFSQVSDTIIANLEQSLAQDCKTVRLPSDSTLLAFGQLTIWDAKTITGEHTKIAQVMNNISQSWVVSVVCISERRNYLLVSSDELTRYFADLLNLEKFGAWLVSKDHLYLRKEIIAKMLSVDR